MQFSNAIFAISLIFAGNVISAEASALRGANNNRRQRALGEGKKCSEMERGDHLNHGGAGATMVNAAFIHTDCTGDGVYPEYYTNERCNELYNADCTFGEGWYCNDGQDVQDMECDDAFIWPGCTGEGQLVEYNQDTFSNGDTNDEAGLWWMCNYVPQL